MNALALAIAAALALPHAAAGAEPLAPIVATAFARGADAADPHDPAWERVPAAQVPLQPAFVAHPSISGTPSVDRITVQAARSRGRLFLRLQWQDPSADGATGDTATFADGAAIQFPANGKATTTAFMGSADAPVAIGYWRADGRAEALTAAGFGTADHAATSGFTATGRRTARGWSVVMSWPLRPQGSRAPPLAAGREIPVAFAVWNGANGERDGFKAVTLQWWTLQP
jgi:DMSO reductase family type II enzyme heme b subunit